MKHAKAISKMFDETLRPLGRPARQVKAMYCHGKKIALLDGGLVYVCTHNAPTPESVEMLNLFDGVDAHIAQANEPILMVNNIDAVEHASTTGWLKVH